MSMSRSRAARAGLVLVLIAGMFVVTPRAWACSCAGPEPTDEEAFEGYDVVFVGEARTMRFADRGGDHPDQIWTFRVDRVNRGDALEVQDVHTPHDGGLCAFPFREGRRYQVWADRWPNGSMHTALCGKTREAAGGTYEPQSYPPLPTSSGPGTLPSTGVPAEPLAGLALVLSAALIAGASAPRLLRARR